MKEDKKNDNLMQYKKVSCWKVIQKIFQFQSIISEQIDKAIECTKIEEKYIEIEK